MNICTYKNGNHRVLMFEDGTKISQTLNENDTTFISDFPESIDLKITNKCDMGCLYCHENSIANGLHGDITEKFIDTLRPYTEVAIGGGNPLAHPQLMDLLTKLRKKDIYANMTINLNHFVNEYLKGTIQPLLDKHLIYGLGISYDLSHIVDENNIPYIMEILFEAIKKYPNIVIHVIAGATPIEQVLKLYNYDVKMLVLGYKHFRRGNQYYQYHELAIENNLKWWNENIVRLLKNFKCVSFDNLAIRQLNLENKLDEKTWKTFYQGDDGTNTMYVDLVNRKFAMSSTSETTYDLMDNIDDMFKVVVAEHDNKIN